MGDHPNRDIIYYDILTSDQNARSRLFLILMNRVSRD